MYLQGGVFFSEDQKTTEEVGRSQALQKVIVEEVDPLLVQTHETPRWLDYVGEYNKDQ